MNATRELAEAVKAVSPEGAARPPAPKTTMAQTEERFGVHLPPDMVAFYRTMNGMDSPTHPNSGWIRVWDLESWHRVRDEPGLREASLPPELEDAIILADHCDESWWYAATFSSVKEELRIHLVDGLRPAKLVARSFTAFVN